MLNNVFLKLKQMGWLRGEKKRASSLSAVDFFHHVLEENRALKKILYLMPGCLYWKARSREYLFINQELEEKFKTYGVEKKQVIAHRDEEIFDYRMALDFKQQDEEVIESGKEILFDYCVRWHGEKIADRILKRPVCDEYGNVVATVGCFLLNAVPSRVVSADDADRLKLSFIRDMEHDIRTPMSGIVGLSRILYEHESCPEKKDNLRLIVLAAEELLGYCNGILEFSKISRGLYPTVLKIFDLKEMVENIIRIEQPAAICKHIALELQCSEDMPRWVKSDPYRIEKIVMNLIGNAIKFTQQGYVRVVLEFKHVYERNIIGSITVVDTGGGIPETVQTYLYKTFVRGESANRGLSTGIGIGLQVVKEFIHDLGGEIDIASESSRGTKIRVSIPLQISLSEPISEESA